jgi:predicted phage terminase large subunit-like protein
MNVVWKPNPGPQTGFLAAAAYEVLYGGAAGGGKSESLLAAPLRWAHEPSFRAIVLRRTYPELERSIIDRSRQLYPMIAPGATYNAQEKSWRFPSGARIFFGHAEHEHSVHVYQGAEFQFIGFDELTHFTEKQYTYMLSRARSSSGLPIRVRATTNPGGPGHEWVLNRWAPWLRRDDVSYRGSPADPGEVLWYMNTEAGEEWVPRGTDGALSRCFIPASIDDNPHLAKNDPGYRQRLMGLDRVTRAQLLSGDWLAQPAAGEYFRRGWFKYSQAAPYEVYKRVRAWDLASTDGAGDWTVGVLLSRTASGWCIENVVRIRQRPSGVEATVLATAKMDPPGTSVHIPQDPGQAGKSQAEAYTRLLAGHAVYSKPITGDKVTRAKPASAQVEAGNVSMVEAPWNKPFLESLEAFPTEGIHDDDVDAFADAFNATLTPAAQLVDLGPMPTRRM